MTSQIWSRLRTLRWRDDLGGSNLITQIFKVLWPVKSLTNVTSFEDGRKRPKPGDVAAAAAAKSLQSCPTLYDPRDGSPPGSPRPWDSPGKNTGVGCHFLLQCVKMKVKSLSCVRLLATPWTAAYQAPPSTGFSRQEYWSGVPLPLESGKIKAAASP